MRRCTKGKSTYIILTICVMFSLGIIGSYLLQLYRGVFQGSKNFVPELNPTLHVSPASEFPVPHEPSWSSYTSTEYGIHFSYPKYLSTSPFIVKDDSSIEPGSIAHISIGDPHEGSFIYIYIF